MPLKIMPFGASIVFGEDSTDGNGFRLRLRDMLEANGNTVSYVGTVFHGNMTNNACEAYPGHTIQEVSNLALQSGTLYYPPLPTYSTLSKFLQGPTRMSQTSSSCIWAPTIA